MSLYKRLLETASKGDPDSQYQLGRLYANGDGIEEDQTAAFKWYKDAAERGNVKAQLEVGSRYFEGFGVEQNLCEAVIWFRMAAASGYAQAQYKLGYCYAEGEGVVRDDSEAVRWYRRAAEQGHKEAQFSLAVKIQYGVGIEPDSIEAAKWYREAADQGCDTAAWVLNGGKDGDGKGLAEKVDYDSSDEPEVWPIPFHQPTGSITNPKLKYPFDWLVPWTEEQRKTVLVQHLEGAEAIRKQQLQRPCHDSLEDFLLLIQDDARCEFLDYSLLTRWISTLPFLCACQDALQSGTATRSQVEMHYAAIHLWLNIPRGPLRRGDMYLFEIWFCILDAVIKESAGIRLPRLAMRQYSDPDTLASISQFDLTKCSEFKTYLGHWKARRQL